MCVAMRAATVIVPVRTTLMVVLFVSILLMRMIVPVRFMLTAVLFRWFFFVRMIMPMWLLVLVRVVSMRIVTIGHVFASCRRLA